MRQYIPHSGNLAPGYVRSLFCQCINAVIFKGLPDDFKIPDHSILGFAIRKKRLQSEP